MSERLVDKTPFGALRSFYEWLTGAGAPAPPAHGPDDAPTDVLPARVSHYAISHKLGEGGMGVVYAAHDEKLQRTVALKMMASFAGDEAARRRFWREARAAASVNHPNVCQIYEVGEHEGQLFIVMELLEGEVLADRLRQGPLSVDETVRVGLGILSALSALHARGVVHRDLKPSNVFLAAHGVKLLDFGLARTDFAQVNTTTAELTRAGSLMGTPRYMAPEQVAGETADARTDLYAAGAILFEMLAGRPAFTGRSVVDVLHATVHEHPPALTGSPAIAAVDRVIRRALAKRPSDRPSSAESMAGELRAVGETDGRETATVAHALTRLVVLPFRVLRPDPETDFLAFSLPDALATSLSGVRSLVLRSAAAAARFAGEAPDLRALAAEADVDRVVMGTIVRAGDQLRVNCQLVEAPGGTLVASHAAQAAMGDLFRLQDDLAQRLVAALSRPLAGATAASELDSPHDPRAYELYLRANELARTYDGLPGARDSYQQSLELDPRFAPAWARLGRCYRVIGKFIDGAPDSPARAEDAFRRALALNPRLTIAHKFYANLEAEIGRGDSAIVRLLGEASRHGNDPELFAGLVHACRYCGLLQQSVASHREARRLDPNVPTGVDQTFLLAGDLEKLLAEAPPPVAAGADDGIRVIGLGLAGRLDEARERLLLMRQQQRIPAFVLWTDRLLSWIDRRADAFMSLDVLGTLKIREDPEAIFQEGWLLCDVGHFDAGLARLQMAVGKGYFAPQTLAEARQFDRLRDRAEFQDVLQRARDGQARALAAYQEAGGVRLLGE